jgi:hypothetical protein
LGIAKVAMKTFNHKGHEGTQRRSGDLGIAVIGRSEKAKSQEPAARGQRLTSLLQ